MKNKINFRHILIAIEQFKKNSCIPFTDKLPPWNGQGAYTYQNGEQYNGEWKDGLYDGQGTLIYSNGHQ